MADKKKKGSSRASDTWNTITGVMSIYGNTFTTKKKGKKKKFVKWSTTIGRKDEDGEYVNYYLRVRFAGDASEPETGGLHQIDVGNAFLSVESYENRDGDDVVNPVLVVTENEILDYEPDEEDREMTSKSSKKTSKKKKSKDEDEDDEDEEDEDDEDDLPF